MPVNSTHPDYDENLEAWQRIRDVLAGDRAIKRAGEKYVARLDSQNDDEFRAYIERGFFYNATSRTVSGYVGMIFRRDPVLQLPEKSVALHPALKGFINDVDLLGTTLDSYAKNIIEDVVALGRAGTLIDWDGEKENRAYVSMYAAESILNWRQTRINGLLKLSLVVLAESATDESQAADPFVVETVQQIRVLKLVSTKAAKDGEEAGFEYQVEIWQLRPGRTRKKEKEWQLIRAATPLRLGKPLSAIPFIFHGPVRPWRGLVWLFYGSTPTRRRCLWAMWAHWHWALRWALWR